MLLCLLARRSRAVSEPLGLAAEFLRDPTKRIWLIAQADDEDPDHDEDAGRTHYYDGKKGAEEAEQAQPEASDNAEYLDNEWPGEYGDRD